MTCPNIQSPQWTELISRIGLRESYKEFIKNGYEIPDPNKFKPVSNIITESDPKKVWKEVVIEYEDEEGNKVTLEENTPEYTQVENKVLKAVEVLSARKNDIEKLRKSVTKKSNDFAPTEKTLDTITELIRTMNATLVEDGKPNEAYGQFLDYAIGELTRLIEWLPKHHSNPKWMDVALEAKKYIASYRGIHNMVGNGSLGQQRLLNVLTDKLDLTQTLIDDGIKEQVLNIVKTNQIQELTDKEIKDIIEETTDISFHRYGLEHIGSSNDKLLAITDQIFKKAKLKAKDASEELLKDLNKEANELLKSLGKKPGDKNVYDFMYKKDKEGKPTGELVSKFDNTYDEIRQKALDTVLTENGERKQYILESFEDADLEFNKQLFEDKAALLNIELAESVDKDGIVSDGTYRKYTDEFKAERAKFEEWDGVHFQWVSKSGIDDKAYKTYLNKYYSEPQEYNLYVKDDFGDFVGYVQKAVDSYGNPIKRRYVKSDFIELKDIASNGKDLRDPMWLKIQNGKTSAELAQKKYYNYYIKIRQELDDKLPSDVAYTMRGQMPRVRANFIERASQNGQGIFKAAVKGLSNFFTPDHYMEMRPVDETGFIRRTIPVMFVGKLKNEATLNKLKADKETLKQDFDNKKLTAKEYHAKRKALELKITTEENKVIASDLETDATVALTAYATMVENYNALSEIENNLLAIQDIVEKRKYIMEDGKGNPFFKKDLDGLSDKDKYYKRKEDALAVKRLRAWFQDIFYNDNDFDKEVMSQVMGKLQYLTSVRFIAFNFRGAVGNYIMGRINNNIEALGSLYFSKKSFYKAAKLYTNDYCSGVISSLGKNPDGYQVSKEAGSKYEAMVQMFRMIGEMELQTKNSKWDLMKYGHFIRSGGEYNVQSKTGVAFLLDRKIKNSISGEESNIYDAFVWNPNDKTLTLGKGFKLSNDEKYRIINQIREINIRIHGNYAKEDKMLIQRHWLGQLVAQFHKHLYPAFKSRFIKKYTDENLGEVEGRYRSVLSFFKHVYEVEGSFVSGWSTGWKGMSETEKGNIISAAAEVGYLLASLILMIALKKLGEDLPDEDKKAKKLLNFLQFQQSKQIQELAVYMPGVNFLSLQGSGQGEFESMIKNPIVAVNGLHNMSKAIGATMSLPFPPYDDNRYEAGVFEGDLKAWKYWKDALPILTLLNQYDNYSQVKSFYVK